MSDIDLCIISVSAIISIETPRHLLLLLLVKVSPHRRKICSFVCLIYIISQELIIKLLFRGPQQINICDWGYLAHQNKSRWRQVEVAELEVIVSVPPPVQPVLCLGGL